jgi:hypothetical protein
MYIDDRLFSENTEEVLYSVLMDEEEYDLFSEFQKEFGAESKALAIFAPGAYEAKEAAKYAYDDPKEYRKKRGMIALKGFFAPGTSTAINEHARQMALDGASKKEIRDYIENRGKHHSTGRVIAGTVEALTPPLRSIGTLAARGKGLYDKFAGRRAEDLPDKKKKR